MAAKKKPKSYFDVGDKVHLVRGTLRGIVKAKRYRESDSRWLYSIYTTDGLDVHNVDEIRLN